LRKVEILLRAFEEAKKAIQYFALDLSLSELHRTLSAVPSGKYHYVKCAGLHGTYDDGLAWLKRTKTSAKATCVLSLGSSIGNFTREDAAKFLHQFSLILGPQDSLLIGLDSCQDAHRIFQAYNDSEGVTEAFYRNGLNHANRLLGYEGFKQNQWAVVGSYDAQLCCHNANYAALDNISINGIQIEKGSSVHLEKACKYSGQHMKDLWHASGLLHQAAFSNEKADYSRSHSLKHDKYCRLLHSSILYTQRQVVKTESSRIRL
jgi:L-histidine Nalpha-methyltransferase / hercynylcysteine S-oxide synthase